MNSCLNYFVVTILFLTTSSLFTIHENMISNSSERNFLEFSTDVFLKDQEWGPWQETSCYKGLDYRTRIKRKQDTYDGVKYIWTVQFRNRYSEKINFGYRVYEEKPENPQTLYRPELNANAVGSEQELYMENGNSIYVFVDKVRFGKDDYGDYYQCDK